MESSRAVAVYEGTLGYIQETHTSTLTIKEHTNPTSQFLYIVVKYWAGGKKTVMITLLQIYNKNCTFRSHVIASSLF